ncbi:PfkB family carbohydrate kinase [Roseateles sp. BYS78W]|uniref:PfkB family carbohydrate kinase n=1 Tax=Pelomonas candidula TaxID=3299025 RepID=A0ABW7H8M8_9BURK
MQSVQPADRAVLVLGEALVDQFSDGAVPGGAPFNVARSLAWLGVPVGFISRIGADDADGRLLLDSARRYGLDTAGLQRDAQHATGRVSVHEQADGSHRFEIHADAAWDHIEPVAVQREDGIAYFGTLAQRSAASRASLRAAVKHGRGLAFLDLNLRPGPDLRELAAESLMLADWVKVNEDELATLLDWFAPEGVAALTGRFALQRLVVTRGAAGYALIGPAGDTLMAGEGVQQPQLVDTVGAGDAFTAMLLAGLALRRPLAVTLGLANRYAAAICGLRGPLPADPAALQPWREALQALRSEPEEALA